MKTPGVVAFILILVSLASLGAAPSVSTNLAPLLSPPAGRPPIGPLERYEPRIYTMTYQVDVSTMIPYGQDDPRWPRDPKDERPVGFGGTFHLEDTPIVMPLIFQGAYHRLDPDSISAALWLEGRADAGLRERFRIDEGAPHHTHLAVLPIPRFVGKNLRWNIKYRVKAYSSRIDEQAAQKIAWPREWPREVADGLAPQMYIESDDPIFAETVQRVSEGQLRFVPPYLAAKDLVRYCLNELQISGSALYRGREGVLHGMNIIGARAAAKQGKGNEIDLVCVCVAILRAAGIPARPVIGVEEDSKGRDSLVVWAEFFLPDAGWVPFDPAEMRGKAIRNRNVKDPWPEFGEMKDLNHRIPLSYHFIPPKAVESPQRAAVWGWDPRPNAAPTSEQRIDINIVSYGPAPDDPR